MLEASVKEVEILKDDIKDIKASINKYISYIIGANGIVLLAYKYLLISKAGSDILTVVPFFAIVLIASFYYMLSYKFASHNRCVGFIQLLSQEVNHIRIEKNNKLPISSINNLDEGYSCKNTKKIKKQIPETIISYDGIMSRFSNRIKVKTYPKRHYDKLDFRMLLGEGIKYCDLDEFEEPVADKNDKNKTEKYNIIQGFLKNIIFEYYSTNYGYRRFYSKFQVTSWKFPLYVFWLTVIQISILTGVFVYIGKLEYIFKVILIVLAICIILAFLYDLKKILHSKKSINYYCWSFFTYRVQLLNTYKIRPIYYSTSFLRYYKSAQIINYLKNDETKQKWMDKAKQCGFKHKGDELRKFLIPKLNKGSKINSKYKCILKFCRKEIRDNELK